MVNSLNQVSIPDFSNQNKSKNVKTSIFYVNDVHGRTVNMEKITNASRTFDVFIPNKIDKLKLCSGDTMLGQDPNVNKAANKFLNINNFMATALGNHECDQKPKFLINLIKDAKYKVLGKNINLPENSEFKGRITSSYVQEVNGNKYGIIALMPYDLFLRIKEKDAYKDIAPTPFEQTVKDVQTEIDDLKKKGVNKIVVLSHTGYDEEVKLAKAVEGIDIILGGHSHNLIKGLEEGKNIFYSKKTGEPTIITQAGRDGNYFGILNIEFDENGVIKKAQNNVSESSNFKRNIVIKNLFDDIMGKSVIIGRIENAPIMPNRILKEENPHASFIADIVKDSLKTDICMINSANLRGSFEQGKITDRDVSSITPFKNKMLIVTLNEKEITDAIKHACSSMTKDDGKPGLMQVSGLNYTVNKQGELIDLKFVNINGEILNIDINNPDDTKKYSVALDDFSGQGRDGFTMLNKINEPDTQKFNFDKDKLVIDYIKAQKNPISIQKDNRIKIID